MEMGYRDHIVAKLGALAVAGGTTAMLFAASPVHTTFNAQATGSLKASGATVSQTLAGNLVASELQPGVETNPAIWSVKNTGSVPESFSLQFGTVTGTTSNSVTSDDSTTGGSTTGGSTTGGSTTGGSTTGGSTTGGSTTGSSTPSSPDQTLSSPQLVSALQQLGYRAAVYSCPQYSGNPGHVYNNSNNCTLVQYASDNPIPLLGSNGDLRTFENARPLGSVKAGYYLEVRVWLELSQTPTINPNVWNGASLTIPYTITAEASASAGTSTPPTLTNTSS